MERLRKSFLLVKKRTDYAHLGAYCRFCYFYHSALHYAVDGRSFRAAGYRLMGNGVFRLESMILSFTNTPLAVGIPKGKSPLRIAIPLGQEGTYSVIQLIGSSVRLFILPSVFTGNHASFFQIRFIPGTPSFC